MASIVHRENRNGTVTSMVRFRVNGKQVSESFSTPRGAETFAALVEKIGGEAAVRAREARNSSAAVTLRDFFNDWVDPAKGHLVGLDSYTLQTYSRIAERSFLVKLGDFPIDAITRQDCAMWLEWQREQPTGGNRNRGSLPSPTTLRSYQTVLSAVMKAAMAVQPPLISGNPASGLRIKSAIAEGPTFLTSSEFATLLHFIPDYWKPLILFLVGSGLRFGEATALTWSDIDVTGPVPMVRVVKAWKREAGNGWVIGTPKTKKGRRVLSITDELVDALGPRGAGDELVFKNSTAGGGQVRQSRLYRAAWLRARADANDPEKCAKIGAKPIGKTPRLHDLRHSHASWLIAAHASLPYIQQRLGHEKITTTIDIYGHLAPEAQAQMAEIVAQSMEGVLPRLRLTDAITNGDELVAQITE